MTDYRYISPYDYRTVPEVADVLYKAHARGERVYTKCNGYTLYSDTILWVAEEIGPLSDWRIEERDTKYKEMVEQYRAAVKKSTGLSAAIITKEIVAKGLKIIIENQKLNQRELIGKLLAAGCYFTSEEVEKLFPGECSGLDNDMKLGATVIIKSRDSTIGRRCMRDCLFDGNNPYSMYRVVRELTGDPTYTERKKEDRTKSTHKKQEDEPVPAGYRYISPYDYRTVPEVADVLYRAHARGERVYTKCNGYTLYSDTILWVAEEIGPLMDWRIEERDKKYKEMVAQYRAAMKKNTGLSAAIITKETVAEGLKIIIENKKLNQIELIEKLLDAGCYFTSEEVEELFPGECSELDNDMKLGATVIVESRDSTIGRRCMRDCLFDGNNPYSMYRVVRELTGDPTYTEKKVEGGAKHTKKKNRNQG